MGYRRNLKGITIEEADSQRRLAAVFAKAAATVTDARAGDDARLAAVEILGVAPIRQSAVSSDWDR